MIWGIENLLHHVRERTLRNLAISVFRQNGKTNNAAALRHTSRDHTRPLRALALTRRTRTDLDHAMALPRWLCWERICKASAEPASLGV
jgi:hypothetical protein